MESVTYELVDPVTALRHTVAGVEVAVDHGKTFTTKDPAQIASLDALDAVRRTKEAKKS